MGPTWVLSAPDGPNVGPMNLAVGAFYPIRHILLDVWSWNSPEKIYYWLMTTHYFKENGMVVVEDKALICPLSYYYYIVLWNENWLIPSGKRNMSSWHHGSRSTLVQIKASHLFSAKPLPETMLIYCQLHSLAQSWWNFNQNTIIL